MTTVFTGKSARKSGVSIFWVISLSCVFAAQAGIVPLPSAKDLVSYRSAPPSTEKTADVVAKADFEKRFRPPVGTYGWDRPSLGEGGAGFEKLGWSRNRL